jgi:hypothetical protein
MTSDISYAKVKNNQNGKTVFHGVINEKTRFFFEKKQSDQIKKEIEDHGDSRFCNERQIEEDDGKLAPRPCAEAEDQRRFEKRSAFNAHGKTERIKQNAKIDHRNEKQDQNSG